VWPNYWLQDIRIEDGIEGGRYVVRAEVPGVDPDRDVRVTCEHGHLRLVVTRQESRRAERRSEFRYGRFVRTIPLPPGAQEDTITAAYAGGILELAVTIHEHVPPTRIPVDRAI
jgi:HSP20 family protein